MTFLGGVFYVLGAVTIVATALAVTRRNVMHAIIYLIISFVSTALLFYLLGAPLLAVLEVIIYAGAIVVLFLFIIMMIPLKPSQKPWREGLRQWWPAMVLGVVSLLLAGVIVGAEPTGSAALKTAMAKPVEFGKFLFRKYWLPVEITSFLLLIALVGALYLGRQEEKPPGEGKGESS